MIGGRVRYDAEDLSERSLPLERLLRLVEQPHILDRDDRLGGERLDQLHLVRSERDRIRFAQRDRADRDALSKQWRDEQGPLTDRDEALACLRKFLALG